MQTHAIIMAGGEGKRMQSSLPKVLHHVFGEPMIVRILRKVIQLNVETVYIVCGNAMEQIHTVVNEYFSSNHDIHFVLQPVARGTGDAIKCCLPYLQDKDVNVLILNGDTPLIDTSLQTFVKSPTPCLMVTHLLNPYGNGRIMTDKYVSFLRIIEEKDATEDERKVTLVNCGVYSIPSYDILQYIPKLSSNNAQNEYYLTDICEFIKHKLNVVEVPRESQYELINVNSPDDLIKAERYAIEQHMHKQGLTIRKLEEDDYHKGYLALISQLSNSIDDMSSTFFQRVYCGIQENKNHHIYVVEDKSLKTIIGNVCLLVEPKFIHNGKSVGHIEDVVVLSTHRAMKIGRLMIDYMTTFMNEFNCYKYILDCDAKLEGFYSKCGYENKNIQMSLYKK
jgi:NDP-sugar pyrophosphorylase family protein